MGRTKALLIALVCALGCGQLTGKSQHAGKTLAEAIEAERAGDFDKAYELIQAALYKKAGDMAYQQEAGRIRFEAAAYHVHHAKQQRESGKAMDRHDGEKLLDRPAIGHALE